jgi:hypothetical protein
MALQIKATQVASVRQALLKKQGNRCPLCNSLMRAGSKKTPALDHCHNTGFLRDVLCINCNGLEGRVFSLARRAASGKEHEWLTNLVAYYLRHATPQHGGVLHHTHKTEEDKRLARNAKARKRRAALKG